MSKTIFSLESMSEAYITVTAKMVMNCHHVSEECFSILIHKNENGVCKYGLFFGSELSDAIMLIPCEYDKIEHVGSYATFVLEKNGEYGFCDFTEYIKGTGPQENFRTGCDFESIEFGKTNEDTEYFVLYNGLNYWVYVPMTTHLNEATSNYVIAGDYLIYDYYDDIQVTRMKTGEVVGHIDKHRVNSQHAANK